MIKLSGLLANNPQSVMAGFGLLRVLTERGHKVRIAWPTGTAELQGIDQQTLIAEIDDYFNERQIAPEFCWCNTLLPTEEVKPGAMDLATYYELVEKSDQQTQAWIDSFWYRDMKGKLRSTPLNLTTGNQEFFTMLRGVGNKALLSYIAAHGGVAQSIEQALFNPQNSDDCRHFSWDPSTAKLGETLGGDKPPTSAPHRAEAGAVWLAVEGLPLYPAGVQSAAMGKSYDIWPYLVPTKPVNLSVAQVMQFSGHWLDPDELAAQGWSRWQTRRADIGGGNCVLLAGACRSTTQTT